jgi:hypothetical protein
VTPLRVAFVPPVPALLAAYAGLTDPVAELRAACVEAVAWLVAEQPPHVAVLGDPASATELARGLERSLSRRVADELLDAVGYAGPRTGPPDDAPALLVLANGSGRRSEKAPGHLDERAFDFDESLGKALASGDAAGLGRLDATLAAELLTSGCDALRAVAALVHGGVEAQTRYADDPFGVQYWVVTWQCGS